MNKTISINISGFVFNIEEGAYEKLNHYLDAIKNNFKHEEDCNEIMEDIEARIAELFQEKLSDRKEVIVDSDVEAIIVIMGKPEEYLSDDEPIYEESRSESNTSDDNMNAKSTNTYWYGKKRLYRNETEGVVGGVCSGIGYYVGIDPVLIRAAFVVMTLLGGSGVLLYVILWIVMPHAKTTAEILEMKGQPVNLDSIKDHVKDVKNTIVDNTKGARKNIKSAVDKGVKAGSKLGYVLSKIIGIGFVIWGIFALLILFIVLFGNSGIMPLSDSDHGISLSTILEVIYPDGRITVLFVALILVTLIPVVSIILVGVKLLLGVKTKFRKASIVLVIIWFISAGSLVLMSVELGMNFREHAEIDFEVPINNNSTKVLFVDVMEDGVFSKYIEFNNVWNLTELIKVEDEKMFLGYTNLDIRSKNDSSNFTIILHKESNGFSNKDAINRAEKIEFDLSLNNNKLLISPYFIIDVIDKYRGQIVTVEIQIPLGKELRFGNNIDRIVVDIENGYYRHNQDYANTVWKIDEFNELRCIGCEDNKNVHIYNNEFENTIEDSVDKMTDDIDDALENFDDAIDNVID
jgi:phage shock protein PspC (stress-responsive transcriptional regulator)